MLGANTGDSAFSITGTDSTNSNFEDPFQEIEEQNDNPIASGDVEERAENTTQEEDDDHGGYESVFGTPDRWEDDEEDDSSDTSSSSGGSSSSDDDSGYEDPFEEVEEQNDNPILSGDIDGAGEPTGTSNNSDSNGGFWGGAVDSIQESGEQLVENVQEGAEEVTDTVTEGTQNAGKGLMNWATSENIRLGKRVDDFLKGAGETVTDPLGLEDTAEKIFKAVAVLSVAGVGVYGIKTWRENQ